MTPRHNPTRRFELRNAIAGSRSARTKVADARVACHFRPRVRRLLDEALELANQLERVLMKARRVRRRA